MFYHTHLDEHWRSGVNYLSEHAILKQQTYAKMEPINDTPFPNTSTAEFYHGRLPSLKIFSEGNHLSGTYPLRDRSIFHHVGQDPTQYNTNNRSNHSLASHADPKRDQVSSMTLGALQFYPIPISADVHPQQSKFAYENIMRKQKAMSPVAQVPKKVGNTEPNALAREFGVSLRDTQSYQQKTPSTVGPYYGQPLFEKSNTASQFTKTNSRSEMHHTRDDNTLDFVRYSAKAPNSNRSVQNPASTFRHTDTISVQQSKKYYYKSGVSEPERICVPAFSSNQESTRAQASQQNQSNFYKANVLPSMQPIQNDSANQPALEMNSNSTSRAIDKNCDSQSATTEKRKK